MIKKSDSAAERGVLSGIAQFGKDALLDVADIIDVDAFVDDDNKIIFKCLQHTLDKDQLVDITTIYSAASELKLTEAISTESQKKYIATLFNLPVKLENVRSHGKKLMKLHLIRMAQKKHREAHEELAKLNGDETVPEILSTSESPVFDLLNSINTGRVDIPTQIAEGGSEYLDHLSSHPVDCIGIPTPWPRFNQAVGGGMTSGGVTLIAARPGIGKSSLSTNIALHVAGNLNIPVLYLDTEMSRHQQLCRCLAYRSNVDINLISTGKFSQKTMVKNAVYKANAEIAKIPYQHINVAGQDFETILGIIRRWIFKDVGLQPDGKSNQCLIAYDYFKLMSDESLNKNLSEYQAMGFQISKLTDFAQKYDIPVLSFVQVNRDGVSKDTSDVIAQSDRLLWLAHSLAIWKKKDAGEIMQSGPENGTNKLIMLKHRFGPGLQDGDYINFSFNTSVCKIKEVNTNFEAMRSQQDTGFDTDGDSEEH